MCFIFTRYEERPHLPALQGLPHRLLQHLPVGQVRDRFGGGSGRQSRLLLLLLPDAQASRRGPDRVLRQRLERPGLRAHQLGLQQVVPGGDHAGARMDPEKVTLQGGAGIEVADAGKGN